MIKYFIYKRKDNLIYFAPDIEYFAKNQYDPKTMSFTGVVVEASSLKEAQDNYFHFKGNIYQTEEPEQTAKYQENEIDEAIKHLSNYWLIVETALLILAQQLHLKNGRDIKELTTELKKSFIKKFIQNGETN